MRKPTGSSGQDDFTQKCQTLHRQLFAMEEGDTFGDSSEDEEEEVILQNQIHRMTLVLERSLMLRISI
jgi:hypothetical protein